MSYSVFFIGKSFSVSADDNDTAGEDFSSLRFERRYLQNRWKFRYFQGAINGAGNTAHMPQVCAYGHSHFDAVTGVIRSAEGITMR